jgi:DNA invertase Pin-like site-specific DNA recombinase
MKNNKNSNETKPDELAHAVGAAAIYVRVSSTGQLGRDGDEDGYSIPAQTAACERKSEDMGLSLAKVYIERAESARSDDRPVLQHMMRELSTLGVTHLIVHKVDRLARNRLDDAQLYERLVASGITLVSASANIDATPAGRLMHGMLATFAEYYSNNLSTEIKKGLTQKHKLGGTPFKPPIGYLSKRELIGGQDIRSVVTDPERAPLIQRAFDLYATGDWSLSDLVLRLDTDGLRTCPTAKRPASAITKTHLHKILRNRYYVGIVEWCGKRVVGRHDHLIDPDTFDQVQVLLSSRAQSGDRPSKHEHYLRGSIFCADCGGRLLYSRHRGRGGLYEYFSCRNRASRRAGGTCPGSHLPVDLVEKAVEEHYRAIHLSTEKQAEIMEDIRVDADGRISAARRDMERHQKTIRDLEDNQQRLLQLAYRGLASEQVLKREQDRLESERRAAEGALAAASVHTEDVEERAAEAVRMAASPHAIYTASSPLERRMLNQTFFKQLFIGEDREVVGVNLTPIYAAFGEWDRTFGLPEAQIVGQVESTDQGFRTEKRENPDPSSLGQGLLLYPMVELEGLEPSTSWVRCNDIGSLEDADGQGRLF